MQRPTATGDYNNAHMYSALVHFSAFKQANTPVLRPDMLLRTVQLDLNLTLSCAVPASKNTRSACEHPETRAFLLFIRK